MEYVWQIKLKQTASVQRNRLTVIVLNIAQRVLWPHAVASRIDGARLRFPAVLAVFSLHQDYGTVFLDAREARASAHLIMLGVNRLGSVRVETVDLLVGRLAIQGMVQVNNVTHVGTEGLEGGKRSRQLSHRTLLKSIAIEGHHRIFAVVGIIRVIIAAVHVSV